MIQEALVILSKRERRLQFCRAVDIKQILILIKQTFFEFFAHGQSFFRFHLGRRGKKLIQLILAWSANATIVIHIGHSFYLLSSYVVGLEPRKIAI